MNSKDKLKGKKTDNKNSGKELASNQASNDDEESSQVLLTEIQKLLWHGRANYCQLNVADFF